MLSAAIYGARALFVRYATSGSLAATAPDGAAGRKQNNNERLIMR